MLSTLYVKVNTYVKGGSELRPSLLQHRFSLDEVFHCISFLLLDLSIKTSIRGSL